MRDFLLSMKWQYRCLLVAWSVLGLLNSVHAEDRTDVTAVVLGAVKDNKLVIMADNGAFGDTAPGIPKKLRIDFQIGEKKFTKDFPEGAKVEITTTEGNELKVIKAVYGPADGSKPIDTSNPEEWLDTLPGFRIERMLQADPKSNGSWICMTKDPKGRLLLGGQREQSITRVTVEDGKVTRQDVLPIPITEAMGMLFVDNALYINGANKEGKYCLFRCTDPNGDDSYSQVELLREWQGGAGEHGSHAIALGPDKKLYIVCGNFVNVPTDLAPTSPHRNYGDDLALGRAEDGNGFGAGRMPPGGFIVRMDLDGKNAELYSAGQRNTYDIDFNPDGELFGFDSDMEWDWGTPWYRPIHVFQSVRGGDQGFREGSAKWPEYYQDSLPQTVTIGIGCPTGVAFGRGANFPVKYQKAFYICDWTYGRLIAVHLKPRGAGYTGTWENFVAPKSLRSTNGKTPLNLTDVTIGADGALYFTIGGRGTQASLFRVSYVGDEPAKALPAKELAFAEGRDSRELRRKLESYNVEPNPAAIEAAWPHLSNSDRYIRYAARMAIERNPVQDWQAKALAEKKPAAAFTALLALARYGAPDIQPALLNAVCAFPAAGLSEEQQLEKLRVIEVSLARQGIPTGDVATRLIKHLDPQFPAKTAAANRELSQILLALNAPGAVAKTVELLKGATTQEDQLAYVMFLRKVKEGWDLNLRKAYLSWWNGGVSTEHPERVIKWFEDAGIRFNNGASFANFLAHAHEDAKFTMTPNEIVALNDILSAYAAAQAPKPAPPLSSREVVKEWATPDLQPVLEQVSRHRNFARGKEVFYLAQCSACHRYGDLGGTVGPDLTAVATRFKRQDLLESCTEPSKVVSEQYMNTAIETTEGKVFVGRILEETPEMVVLRPNPLEATTVSIKKSEIETRQLSKVSPMPAGLLNTFKKEDILDLIAYMESLGDSKHPNFRN